MPLPNPPEDSDVMDILYPRTAHTAVEECERLRRALHEIAEEWAGAECGEPVHAQEAYAIGLAKRMYALAAEALRPTFASTPSPTPPEE